MWQALYEILLRTMDVALGWMLRLPLEWAVAALGLMTSLAMVIVRRLVSDQDWLGRADADTRRLKQLARQAARAGDKAARDRHKQTVALIKLRSLKQEGKPLLWAIVPVALLAMWAWDRLAYHPCRVGAPVEVRAFLPTSTIGRAAYIQPAEHLAAETWVAVVERDTYPTPENLWDRANGWLLRTLGGQAAPEGVARWTITPRRPGRYPLTLCYGTRRYETQLLVGEPFAGPAVTFGHAPPVQAIEVRHRPVKLLGFIGEVLFLPAWMVGYLLVTFPAVSLFKKLLRVY